MKKSYLLDWILFISGGICITTGLMLDFHLLPGGQTYKRLFANIHIYGGYIMGVGILLHLFWHKSWISIATRQYMRLKHKGDVI